jgi:predicted dehydrogenase
MLNTRRAFLKHVAGATATLSTLAVSAPGQSPQKRRIRIGQIGVGHAHATKLSVYRSSDDYEVVGIVEPDTELRQGAEANPVYQGLSWMTQEQLLDTPGLEAVLVETRVRDLLDTAEACITAGKHISLDKPAGQSLSQFRRIVQLAERQKLMIQLGYMYRYSPGVVLLRKFLEQGWLGDIFEVHTVMSKVVAPPLRQQLGQYPGGIMFELGCHVLDLVISVLGKPQTVTAFAQHAARPPDDLVDNMMAVLAYERAIASVKSSAMEVEGFARRHLVVCGTEGTLQIQPLDDPAVRVAFSQARDAYPRGYQDIPLPKFTRYVGDAADMASVIRGEKQYGFTYQHDLDVQETLLRASNLDLS